MQNGLNKIDNPWPITCQLPETREQRVIYKDTNACFAYAPRSSLSSSSRHGSSALSGPFNYYLVSHVNAVHPPN